MALPPNIPTSFVPHTTTSQRRFRTDLTGAFGFLAHMVLGIVFLLALGVFFYGRILASNQFAKDAELAKAEASIDPTTAEGFVRLRNRLSSGSKLLSDHIALSEFFAILETLVPTTVRLNSLNISVNDTGKIKLEGSGAARSFNALAVASSAFAKDGRIKDAIFSNIKISTEDSSVSFALSASLDQKLITFSPGVSAATSRVTATTTTATSTRSKTP